MGILKFLSKEKLAEYLDEELRIFLNNKEIYEINQYGWSLDGNPDPEYMGLAMWQVEPPIDYCEISDSAVTNFPHLNRHHDLAGIFKKGVEFKELMKSARHSIGLTYLYSDDDGEICAGLNFNFSDTVMKLGMATERLRELFGEAFSLFAGIDCDDQDVVANNYLQEPNDIFCRQIMHIKNRLAEKADCYGQLLSCVEKLLPIMAQAYVRGREGHDRRNEDFPVEQFLLAATDEPDVGGATKQEESIAEGSAIIDGISEWYKLLIEAGNQVFLAEYLLRNLGEEPQVASIALSQ